jgi:putative ABC transport system permease protein
MTVLGIASLVLSGFLVINTVSAVLAQHVRQIGMMKAVGARTDQLFRMYAGMVLIFGVLSLFVALPLGVLGAQAFVNYLAGSLLNLKVLSSSPPAFVFAIQCVLALIAPLIAALSPILSGTRKTVREAISDYGIGNAKAEGKKRSGDEEMRRKRLSLSPHPLISPSGPLLISLRNTFRRRGRLVLTLITLVLGGAIFVAVLSGRAGIGRTLDAVFQNWRFDAQINLARTYPAEQLERVALTVPGITKAESWAFGIARRQLDDRKQGSSFQVQAPPANTDMTKLILKQGRWLTIEDQNAIVLNTDVLKNELDIELGDVIKIKMDGTQTAEVRVVGIVQGVLIGPFGYMNRAGLASIQQSGGKFSFLAVRMGTQDSITQANILKALEEQFKRNNISVASTELSSKMRNTIDSSFNTIIYLLLSMAILLAIVGGLGLAGTMSINVLERTREIGVMRAIGANNSAIRNIVMAEGLAIGLISWALTALLAIPLSMGVTRLLGTALEFEMMGTFSYTGLGIWFAMVVFIAVFASVLPAWNASRLTVREVLSYA